MNIVKVYKSYSYTKSNVVLIIDNPFLKKKNNDNEAWNYPIHMHGHDVSNANKSQRTGQSCFFTSDKRLTQPGSHVWSHT